MPARGWAEAESFSTGMDPKESFWAEMLVICPSGWLAGLICGSGPAVGYTSYIERVEETIGVGLFDFFSGHWVHFLSGFNWRGVHDR